MTTYPEQKIGRFMVAVGCIMQHEPTGKILCLKREGSDFQKGEWELMYGRIDQHEELLDGLRREVFEETGIQDFSIIRLLRLWHFYRGEKIAEKELHGFTFHCTTTSQEVTLSPEHSEFAWLDPAEALEKIAVPGIKMDVQVFMDQSRAGQIAISGVNQTMDELQFI